MSAPHIAPRIGEIDAARKPRATAAIRSTLPPHIGHRRCPEVASWLAMTRCCECSPVGENRGTWLSTIVWETAQYLGIEAGSGSCSAALRRLARPAHRSDQ